MLFYELGTKLLRNGLDRRLTIGQEKAFFRSNKSVQFKTDNNNPNRMAYVLKIVSGLFLNTCTDDIYSNIL